MICSPNQKNPSLSYCFITKRHFSETFNTAGILTREDIEKRVINIVQNFGKLEDRNKVTATSDWIKDLNLDSLDCVELVMALEDEFAVPISDTDMLKIRTCSAAIEHLVRQENAF